jgi:hypothetical protein
MTTRNKRSGNIMHNHDTFYHGTQNFDLPSGSDVFVKTPADSMQFEKGGLLLREQN